MVQTMQREMPLCLALHLCSNLFLLDPSLIKGFGEVVLGRCRSLPIATRVADAYKVPGDKRQPSLWHNHDVNLENRLLVVAKQVNFVASYSEDNVDSRHWVLQGAACRRIVYGVDDDNIYLVIFE